MNYENKYVEDLHRKFDVSNAAKSLFGDIIKTSTERREDILKDINMLTRSVGLSYALLALYRQQVNSGFVLADPLRPGGKEEKTFFDSPTDITFRLQWNPDRELRKNHALLIEREVIAKNVDEAKLINKDKNRKACYLCKTNIDEQNPGEILFEIDLADEKFYIGANFAYITNNHFTVMSAEHRPQQYRKEIPKILNEFTDKTDGYFRVIFNGRAGASIEWHEHLQVTTEEFPIEQIRINDEDVKYKRDDLKISQPKYYLPVWIVEGRTKTKIETAVDEIIKKWHSIRKWHSNGDWLSLEEQNNTENIIASKQGSTYRTFIILRDRKRLTGPGKKGDMAAFETGGNIVLSYEPEANNMEKINERETFNKASLETVKQMLKNLSPEKQSCSLLTKVVNFKDIGD